MRLNGWQRLWVVLATLWVLAVLVYGYEHWPVDYTTLWTAGPAPSTAGYNFDGIPLAPGAPLRVVKSEPLPAIGQVVPQTFEITAPNGKTLSIRIVDDRLIASFAFNQCSLEGFRCQGLYPRHRQVKGRLYSRYWLCR